MARPCFGCLLRELENHPLHQKTIRRRPVHWQWSYSPDADSGCLFSESGVRLRVSFIWKKKGGGIEPQAPIACEAVDANLASKLRNLHIPILTLHLDAGVDLQT